MLSNSIKSQFLKSHQIQGKLEDYLHHPIVGATVCIDNPHKTVLTFSDGTFVFSFDESYNLFPDQIFTFTIYADGYSSPPPISREINSNGVVKTFILEENYSDSLIIFIRGTDSIGIGNCQININGQKEIISNEWGVCKTYFSPQEMSHINENGGLDIMVHSLSHTQINRNKIKIEFHPGTFKPKFMYISLKRKNKDATLEEMNKDISAFENEINEIIADIDNYPIDKVSNLIKLYDKIRNNCIKSTYDINGCDNYTNNKSDVYLYYCLLKDRYNTLLKQEITQKKLDEKFKQYESYLRKDRPMDFTQRMNYYDTLINYSYNHLFIQAQLIGKKSDKRENKENFIKNIENHRELIEIVTNYLDAHDTDKAFNKYWHEKITTHQSKFNLLKKVFKCN